MSLIKDTLDKEGHDPGDQWGLLCRAIVMMECGQLAIVPPEDATPLERELIDLINWHWKADRDRASLFWFKWQGRQVPESLAEIDDDLPL